MSRVFVSIASLSLAALLVHTPARAQHVSGAEAPVQAKEGQRKAPEWPQWKGPRRDGISIESGWAAKPKGELWMTTVGLGYSIVTVSGGQCFTMGHDADKQLDYVFAIDPATGFENWTYSFPAATMNRGHSGGTQSSVASDGKQVYVCNREGKTHCINAKTGKRVWARDLGEQEQLNLGRWGFASTPLVLSDAIVVNLGKVFALDKTNGKVLWKSKDNYGVAYSTVADIKWKGKAAYAVFSGEGLAILDPKDGKEIAFHEWNAGRRGRNSATPLTIGDKLFISSGGKGCAMLAAGEKGVDLLWENRSLRTQYSGALHYQGHIYGFDGGTFKCLDLEGNEKWAQRGFGQGAFTIAGGRLVIVTSRGELVVGKASAKGFEELSRTKALAGGRFWTKPVFCDKRVYIRNSLGDIVCLEFGTE